MYHHNCHEVNILFSTLARVLWNLLLTNYLHYISTYFERWGFYSNNHAQMMMNKIIVHFLYGCNQMRFTILFVKVMQALGMVTDRVRYIPCGCFTSHAVTLSKSKKSTERRDLQFYRPYQRIIERFTIRR